MENMEKVIDYIEANKDRYLDELKAFLKIPSVSTDPAHKDDVRSAAEFVVRVLEKAGVDTVRLVETPGHPIVYGERIEDSDLPTILVYGHYDVQPPDPLELWETGPFEPSIRNGEIYARGAADDKGQVFIHFKSTEAITNTVGRLPVNIKFLIEGEEEIGSPNLEAFIRSHRDQLNADAVMISDTTMLAREVPSICYGLRGLVYVQVNVFGPNRDLHSGSFGGPVDNPALVLAQILASLKDESGRITIPGFYDQVAEITERERSEFARLPFDVAAYQEELGLQALAGERGYTPLEQLWVRPTLEVNGLLSGFVGPGAKTVLPAKAMAKVSMRLVPHQDPLRIADLFESHVMELAPPTVRVEVLKMQGGKAWVASLDHPALVAAGKAIEKGFGKAPVFQREGGSIPIVATFSELLKTPSVLMGIGLPDENAHAPNEKLDLSNFFRGIKSSAYFYNEFPQVASD